jgi:hypothetical protein
VTSLAYAVRSRCDTLCLSAWAAGASVAARGRHDGPRNTPVPLVGTGYRKTGRSPRHSRAPRRIRRSAQWRSAVRGRADAAIWDTLKAVCGHGHVRLREAYAPRREAVRGAVLTAAMVWAGVFGLVALIVTVELFASYLRGPTNSGDVPSTLIDVVIWSAVINAFMLPFTLMAGVVAGLVVGVIRRGVRRP